MAESFDEVCANIKACLNSSKRQVSLSDLNRDYHSVLGTSIPFRSLGYHSLEQFIRVVPNLKISNVGSEIYVDVKLDAKTMHITNLVRGQKSTAKKKPVRNFSGKTDYYKPPPPLRRSPTPSKSQYRGGSRFNAPNYYEEPQYIPPKRNLTVQNNKEDFNNHGDQPRVDSSFNRKYKSSSVSHNNFSDEQVKYIDLTSDCRDSPVLEYNRSINLHVISGNSRKVTVSRPINRSMGNDRSKNNSVDEDYGYSSMKSHSKYSIRSSYVVDEYPRRETRPNDYQNQNPSRGRTLYASPRDGFRKEGPQYDNFKITIKNNGPRDDIKLSYEKNKR